VAGVYDACLGTTTKRRSHKSQDTQRTPHFPHYLCTLSEQTSALTGRAQTDPMAKLIDHAIIALLCNTTFSYRHIRYTLNERLSPGGCSRRSFDIQKVHSIRFQSRKEPVEETLRIPLIREKTPLWSVTPKINKAPGEKCLG
jgi:hypothetical protein